jgi:putative endonuclease
MEDLFYIYVLFSSEHQKIYIGFTSNIQARLAAHNHPKNKGWTRNYKTWKVIYTERFDLKKDAMNREKQLKSARGRKFIHDKILPRLDSNDSPI